MKDVFLLIAHLLITAARVFRPGGVRAVIAENLLLKQQLQVVARARQRAPNLVTRLIGSYWDSGRCSFDRAASTNRQ